MNCLKVLPRIFVCACCLLPGSLFAQGKATPSPITQVPLLIGNLDVNSLASPSYSVRTDMAQGRPIGPNKWLEVRADYRSNVEWIDEMTFKYYVLFQSADPRNIPSGGDKITLITGDVTYTDVIKARQHSSAMFLSPTKHYRYGKVIAFAVQVEVNGKTVAGETKEAMSELKGTKWWEKRPPQRLLLNRTQTPFYGVDFDSYSDIKTDSTR